MATLSQLRNTCVRQDSSLLLLVSWQHLCWLLSAQLVVRSLTFPSETEQQLIAEYFATAFRIRITKHCYLWHKALWFFHAVLLVIQRRKILSSEGLWFIGRPATWSVVPMPSVSPRILPGCISYGCMCLALLKNDSLRENLSLQASGSSVFLGRIRNLILTPNLVCFLQGFKGDIAKWVGNSFWLKFGSLEGKTVWRDRSGWSMAVGFRIQGRHTPWREAGGWSWHTVKGGFVFSFPFCAEAAAPGIPLESQPHQRVKGRVFT